MRVVGAHRLNEVVGRSAPCLAGAIFAWYAEVAAATWTSNADVRVRHPHAQFSDGRVCFNLGQDDYCVVVRVNYEVQAVLMTYLGPRLGEPGTSRVHIATKPT